MKIMYNGTMNIIIAGYKLTPGENEITKEQWKEMENDKWGKRCIDNKNVSPIIEIKKDYKKKEKNIEVILD